MMGVISLSTIDWEKNLWNQFVQVIGLLFDASVHGMNAWFIGLLMGQNEILIGMCIIATTIFISLFTSNKSLFHQMKKTKKPKNMDWHYPFFLEMWR